MKIQAVFILIFIMIISLNSGCAPKVKIEYVPVKIMTPIEPCHSEEDLLPIVFDKLDKMYYISSLKNEDIKVKNFLKFKTKYENLMIIIQCYDKQVKKSKEVFENKKEKEE